MMTATEGNTTPRVVRDCTLDWVKIDAAVARDGNLDPTAKALYMALATFADARTRDTDADPNGFDIPTRKALAACIGVSVDTVDRATDRLEAYRINDRPLLIVERRKDPLRPKSHLPSVYHLLDHELWDARGAERDAARKAARSALKGGRTGAATPSRMDAATPGRTGAATPSRMDAAVPITSQKTTTTPRAEGVSEAASAAETGVGGGGVRQSEQNLGDLQGVLRSDAYAMLTLDERSGLAALVSQLLGAGWTTAQIRSRQPDRRVSATTTHPHTHIRGALETLIADPVPGAAADPWQAAASRAHAEAAERLAGARDDARFAMRAAKLAEPHTPEWNRLDVWIKGAPLADLQAFSAAPTLDVLADLPQAPPRRRKFAEAAAALSGSISI
jgi:hypothetical protein